ncbi:MAG: hypothetical protein NTZ09_04695, partial [Candidatus Hydrogenedentes bacterium]|nr:hypothetical protein [Candidatus Hydrogenedentota bacterium]
TIATSSATLVDVGSNEFVLAQNVSSAIRVTRFRAEPGGSVSEVWTTDIPDRFLYFTSPISARPDGQVSFFAYGDLCTVSADGSWADYGSIDLQPSGLFAMAGSGYCYFTGGFYSDITVGDTTLVHKGSGDFFIARATNVEKYKITARCEGPGWIDFHQAGAGYWKGETATLTAVPIFPGVYEFAEWGNDFAGRTDPEVTFPVIEDKEVVAIFEHVDGAPELPAASLCGLIVLGAVLIATGARARRH